jgi:hypothetical protein
VTGVKFWPGPPSTLGEKVASGLVLRFSTFNCVNNNLDCFEDGFGDKGSFLDVGGHRFYVAVSKPFPEEVTDVSDPLYDAGSSCSECSDLGAMVKVLALEDGEGDGLARTRRSNVLVHKSKTLHLQRRTSWLPPSWICERPSTSPLTPLRPPKPWSGLASPS